MLSRIQKCKSGKAPPLVRLIRLIRLSGDAMFQPIDAARADGLSKTGILIFFRTDHPGRHGIVADFVNDDKTARCVITLI